LRNKLLSQKIGIIIVARCTSSRLPGKALRHISGKESIVQVINRMKRCKIPDYVILATSTDSTDDILVEIAQREGIAFYRGSLSEVAKRYLGAAHQYELNHFVRVTGDALLCDEIMVDKAIESHLYNSCDITFMKNMPFGTHKEIVSINALETIVKMAEEPDKTEYLEYYLENERYFSVNYCHSDYNFDSKLRLTLDYEEDLKLFNTIYSHFDNIGNTDFTLSEAIHWLGENPEIAKINMDKTQKFKLHETKNFYSQDLNVRLKI
jgi:spore coat polysaccharide biosynthesis protein SpsF